jgi:2-oxoisovalerate dehydrogenase E1 component alpha subunit
MHSHTLFVARNNGYAISTPTQSQYHGDGILLRAVGYGMPSIRVDGSDVLAVYAATKRAREIIHEANGPVLIETMAYRVGHHSTSDDSSAYRSKDEVQLFDDTFSPIKRFSKFLITRGWWAENATQDLVAATKQECLKQLQWHEKVPGFPPEEMFNDTFAEPTPELLRQKQQTLEHYHRHKEFYDRQH